MFFGQKDAKKSSGISVSQTARRQNPVISDLWRLIWFSLAIALLASLLSYSPKDPSFSTWASKPAFHNWMGRSGSIVSDLLYQGFGLTAFLVTFILFLHAFTKHRFQEETNDSTVSNLIPFIFLISVSGFIQAIYPKSITPWSLPNPGGISGRGICTALNYLTGHLGTILITLSLSLGSATLLFRWKVFSWTIEKIKTLFEAVRTQFGKLQTAIHGKYEAWKNRPKKPTIPPISIPKIEAIEPMPEPRVVEHEAPVIPPIQVAIAPEIVGGEVAFGPQVHFGPSEDDAELVRTVAPGKGSLPKTQNPKIARKPRGPFQLPGIATLSGRAESKVKSVDKNWYVDKANILVQKLKDFGVEGEVTHISPGPVITVYEFKPASGVKIKDIANLSDDLTLALSVLSVRIVAPIPGKPVVGIEIPSPHRETVFFKDLVQETPFFNGDIRIPIALGRLASGEPLTADLAAMPHLLVAGTTGTGKSVFINTMIASLLFRFSPEQLKLILVDPKMVELSLYDGIPHLLLPVVVDSKKAALALRWAVDEMERRYSLMHQFGVRHLDAYNERIGDLRKQRSLEEGYEEIPYIVVVIDEYADLMAVVPKDVELSIARLAQKARASGIHLVLATQRPSTDVVTGTIKANFPSRISFRVASAVDSKTILDRTGAERLLGHGDLLFHTAGFATLKRMQGSFISDADVAKVVEYLKSQGEPQYDERMMQALEAPEDNGEFSLEGSGDGDDASLYDRAVRIVTERGEASISLVQRQLKIGYNRAADLIDRMEREGVISPSTGNSKRRTVLVNSI